MARTQTTDTEARAFAATAKDADSAATADRQKAEARMNVGFQMLQRAGEVALAAAMLGGKAAIVGLRGTIPMLELYRGTTRKLEQGGDGDSDGGGLEKLGLSRGEAGVVRKASTKGMLEALEISSITHPVFEGAPVYRAYNSDGVQFSRWRFRVPICWYRNRCICRKIICCCLRGRAERYANHVRKS